MHIVYFVVRYIPGTVVKDSGVYWSTPGSTSYEYSTMYSSNTVQRTEWYATLITTPFPINCEAPTSSSIYLFFLNMPHLQFASESSRSRHQT